MVSIKDQMNKARADSITKIIDEVINYNFKSDKQAVFISNLCTVLDTHFLAGVDSVLAILKQGVAKHDDK